MLLVRLLALALLQTAAAQTTVEGRVTDARSGAGLPAATVQVVGTSRGTITNGDGDYRLVVPPGADSLVVRFLGYESVRRAIPASGRVDFALAPVVASLGEAVVTAGNPADNIMRRVIERKARWQADLRTWRAEAYSRQTMRADSQIIGVIEGQSVTFWDRDRGTREVVTATRVTGNLDGLPAGSFGAAEQTINFYDDDIDFGGYTLMGPTHPRALSFYRFTLEGSRALGDELVYEIGFAPRNPLQPGLAGTVSVLANADALLAVSVRPSDAVQFPLVSRYDLAMNQQYSSFGQSVAGEPVWLPVDFRMDAQAKPGNALIRFPQVRFTVNSRLTDYAVNVTLPDSLYAPDARRISVDSVSVAEALPVAGVVPLSEAEERAFAEIDSTLSFAKALQPTGLLARFVTINDGAAPSGGGQPSRRLRWSIDPDVRYNRVEGAVLAADATARFGRQRITLGLGYQTARQDVAFSLSALRRLSETVFVGGDVHDNVGTVGRTIFVTPSTNSAAALISGEDYFDYVTQTGGQIWVGRWGQSAPYPVVSGWLAYDEYGPARVSTQTSLLGDLDADNVSAGFEDVASAGVRVRVGQWTEGLPVGLSSQRGASVWVEGGQVWGIDLREAGRTYGRVEGEVRWAAPTFLRRRLFTPMLHVRLAAGTASSDLPVGRSFGIDAQLAGVSSFGALRSRAGRLVLARQYALVAWEHDFRSIPFELLGWRGAAPRGVSLQIHGAHAWADGAPGALNVEPSVVHHEVGASLGLGYSIPVRLDVTYRLTDDPGVVVGIGLARLF